MWSGTRNHEKKFNIIDILREEIRLNCIKYSNKTSEGRKREGKGNKEQVQWTETIKNTVDINLTISIITSYVNGHELRDRDC